MVRSSTISLVSDGRVSRTSGPSLTRIREAARKLFVERGYHDTRPQDIAREAGVASGTFYLHFAHKQQAFLDFAEQAQDELIEWLGHRLLSISGSRERWQVLCEALLDYGEAHPGLLQAAFLDPVFVAPNDDSAWQMYDRLGYLVGVIVRQGHLPADDYDHELISHGLCGLLRHAMIYAGRRELDKKKLVADLSRFIDRGLGGSEPAAHEQEKIP